MIYLDLIFNLSFLVALSLGSNLIDNRWQRHTRSGIWLQGILFGSVAVLGLLHPINIRQGVLLDGRTVINSICALFFGPWAASASGAMTIACRAWLGGPGAVPGYLGIVASIAIGLLARSRRKPESAPPSIAWLYLFGLVVQLSILAIMLSMLHLVDLSIVKKVAPPMILLHPLATALVGKILADQIIAGRVLKALRKSEALLKESQALSKVGGWELDVATGHITWTDEMYDIVGVKASNYDPDDIDQSLRFFAPEIIPEIRRHLVSAVNQGTTFDIESIFTRADGEQIWVRTIGKPDEKDGKVVRVSGYLMDITERKQREEAWRQSEKRFQVLVESSPDAIFVEAEGRFAYLNPSAVRLFGADSPDDMIGTPILDRFFPKSHQAIQECIRLLYSGGNAAPLADMDCLRQDGSQTVVEISAALIEHEHRNGILFFMRDISHRIQREKSHRLLENKLIQAQKMESVGRLAGGVAHDFNNMLSVIIGYSELALAVVEPENPLSKDLEQILVAGKRSRDITRQLLAFARQQTIAPKVLNLNDTVEGMLKMLRRLIGEDIDLSWNPKAGLPPVRMDPSQVDQILANLLVNARDAIDGVGKVTIETDAISIDEEYCADHAAFVPGDFVVLAVSDDGCGMDREILAKVFEPFFTTKAMGKGTGLGLATVYGIVKQNDGFITVYSEPGKGTTIRIFIPVYAGALPVEHDQRPAEEIPKGRGETVLVSEDDALALRFVNRVLNDLGYSPLLANSPTEALEVATSHSGDISLLLTDVIMPEMSGRELARRLAAIHPELKCLYMSGYTANVIAHRGVLDEGVHFIQKPFSKKDLAVKIKEVLETAERCRKS